MSFFTSLLLYRPTKPPTVTGESLAAFIRTFVDLGISDNKPLSINVKFGSTIDQDDRQTSWLEEGDSLISKTKRIEWDLTIESNDLSATAAELVNHEDPVYRAFVDLGVLRSDIYWYLRRPPSEENENELSLDRWSLELGPIVCGDLISDTSFRVGWMSMAASGDGYLYPWTLRELVHRAGINPDILRLKSVCETMWPVVEEGTISNSSFRNELGDLWPYAETDDPKGWLFGVHETG